MIDFSIKGGDFIAMGGYTFSDLVHKVNGQWSRQNKPKPINTATGEPGDTLGAFPRANRRFRCFFPAQAVGRLRTSPGQYVVDATIEREGELSGWAASGVVGFDQARWIPLIETYDCYNRPRGAAAALMLNYNGYYEGSCWAYFGVRMSICSMPRKAPWPPPFKALRDSFFGKRSSIISLPIIVCMSPVNRSMPRSSSTTGAAKHTTFVSASPLPRPERLACWPRRIAN